MDVAALIKEKAEKLGLEADARRDALAGLPAQGASGLTASETGAVAEAERCGKQELERITVLIEQTRDAGTKCDEILAKSHRERQDIEDASPPDGPDLDGLVRDRDGAVAAYNAFKIDNELARDATGDDRVVQVLWAAVIVVLEGLVNSYFYAPVSAFGLLGGFFIAFFVSFANVAFAFMGGAGGLRYLSHVDPLKKLVGVLVSLFCLCICLLVVSLSTFYRAHVDLLRGQNMEAAVMETEAWRLATESLRNLEVWELIASVNSFLLVLVGLVCAILAFYKGWEFDDPYPGLGAAFRAKERATRAYEDAQKRQADADEAWRADHIRELRRLSARLDEVAAEERACVEGLRTAISANSKLGHEAAQLSRGLLGIYRKKNTEVRADDPPAYFDVVPPETDFAHFDADLTLCRDELQLLRSHAERQRADITTEQDRIQDVVGRVRNR